MTMLAATRETGALARFGRSLLRNKMASFGAGIVLLMALSAVFAPWLSPHDPLEQDVLLRLAGPSADYPLGNDSFGRDILSRILWGGRVSLYVSTVSVLIAIVLGGALGILSGYIGGLFDRITMAAMDVLLFREFIKTSRQDPNTGEKWRSPRLVRIKQDWFKE